ncbi:MAG: thiol peroxidase [Myxococcota bacterium]
MATTAFKGNDVSTVGDLPKVGDKLSSFTLTNSGLEDVALEDFEGTKILNIFPSIDTGICAMSVRKFNEHAEQLGDINVLNVSMDLPFALDRFSSAENIDAAVNLSAFRSTFPNVTGVQMTDGPMRGLCARAVLIADGDNVVQYVQLVPEITQEPDYDDVLDALGEG